MIRTPKSLLILVSGILLRLRLGSPTFWLFTNISPNKFSVNGTTSSSSETYIKRPDLLFNIFLSRMCVRKRLTITYKWIPSRLTIGKLKRICSWDDGTCRFEHTKDIKKSVSCAMCLIWNGRQTVWFARVLVRFNDSDHHRTPSRTMLHPAKPMEHILSGPAETGDVKSAHRGGWFPWPCLYYVQSHFQRMNAVFRQKFASSVEFYTT